MYLLISNDGGATWAVDDHQFYFQIWLLDIVVSGRGHSIKIYNLLGGVKSIPAGPPE